MVSLLFNTPTRFVIAFLPRSKRLLISWLQSPSAVILEPKKINSVTVSFVSPSVSHEILGPDAMIFIFECWVLSQLFHCLLSPSSKGSLIPFYFLPWGWCYLHAAAAKLLQSCPTLWPHRRQPTRFLRPWDSPGKSTGEGCHFLLQCMKVKSESEVAQSCSTLNDPMNCSLPGSSAHGIFQATVLEWVAIVICISEVVDVSPSNVDSSLCFIQPGFLHDVLCK